MLKLPVRLDFIGGWSDQLGWFGYSSVMNMSAIWEDKYPIVIESGRVISSINGVGSGLGVSSIVEAGRFVENSIEQCVPLSEIRLSYVQHVLSWEEEQGIKGGWQDQIGALEGGLKLIRSSNHKDFDIIVRNDHPILKHLVLVDTGVRRSSRVLGDKVRTLFSDKKFCRVLEENVSNSKLAFAADAEDCAYLCVDAFEKLVRFVPEMSLSLPFYEGIWGNKVLGAGGGGFALYFTPEPEELVQYLLASGYWAAIPQLSGGLW